MELVFYIYFAFSAIFSVAFLYKKNDNRKFTAIFIGIVYGIIIFPLTLGIVVQKIVDLIEEKENKNNYFL